MEGSDIIHWNNGLWDIADFGDGTFSTPEEYVDNILRVARLLKTYGKAVIFATTTPVIEGLSHNRNETIDRYNALIVPRLREMGVRINDLNGFVKPHLTEYIREDDKVHLTQAGIDACAAQVVAFIKQTERTL